MQCSHFLRAMVSSTGRIDMELMIAMMRLMWSRFDWIDIGDDEAILWVSELVHATCIEVIRAWHTLPSIH